MKIIRNLIIVILVIGLILFGISKFTKNKADKLREKNEQLIKEQALVDTGVGLANRDTITEEMLSKDFDNDGINNKEEFELGLSIYEDDTDVDGITDADEINIYGTDTTKYSTSEENSEKFEGTRAAFNRMEDKANRMLDEANAAAELNEEPIDSAKALEEKYAKGNSTSVDDELAKLKAEMGL